MTETKFAFELPSETSALIDFLDATIRPRPPTPSELSTEEGRLTYAQDLGRRALVDDLILARQRRSDESRS